MEKLRIIPLAVAFGAVWALGMLVLALAAAFGWGTALVALMGSLYVGYDASFLGGIVGALWAFVDGANAGALIALIYNAVARTQKAA